LPCKINEPKLLWLSLLLHQADASQLQTTTCSIGHVAQLQQLLHLKHVAAGSLLLHAAAVVAAAALTACAADVQWHQLLLLIRMCLLLLPLLQLLGLHRLLLFVLCCCWPTHCIIWEGVPA
jgi:hypothetical protein